MSEKREIAVVQITLLAVASIAGAVAAATLGDVLRESDKPAEYIGVTFSILAASLFAVVSIVGDPSMLLSGNWRVGWESAKQTQRDLQKFNYLFLWYLITLGLLVFSEIVEYAAWLDLYFVHNILAFFATFGFVVSFGLPFELQAIQRQRLEQEIRQRKVR